MKHSTKKGRRALSLLLCLVFAWTLAPVHAFAADTYDLTDVAAVNKIIKENGLQAEKDAPESWDFARWSDDAPKRPLGSYLRQPQPDRHIGFWRRWFGGADHLPCQQQHTFRCYRAGEFAQIISLDSGEQPVDRSGCDTKRSSHRIECGCQPVD